MQINQFSKLNCSGSDSQPALYETLPIAAMKVYNLFLLREKLAKFSSLNLTISSNDIKWLNSGYASVGDQKKKVNIVE